MTKIIGKQAKSVGALVANTYKRLRLMPDAFVQKIERFAIGKNN
jgi:hypothetical protein